LVYLPSHEAGQISWGLLDVSRELVRLEAGHSSGRKDQVARGSVWIDDLCRGDVTPETKRDC
jgi:hypothetical protein